MGYTYGVTGVAHASATLTGFRLGPRVAAINKGVNSLALSELMSCARPSRTPNSVARSRRMKIDGEPLPVRREKIIRLIVRPEAESESSHKKITFLHKSSSPRSRTQHRPGNPKPRRRLCRNCMPTYHPRQTDYLRATASR